MKTRNLKNKTWKFPIILFLVFLVFIIALFIRYSYIALSKKVDNINLQEFASNRNTYNKTLFAKRGTIYDVNKNILAVNMSSYTVIAYLSSARSMGSKVPLHVVDKELTAKKLSPIINMSEERILKLLNQEGLYQVELGPGGRNITELQKDKIKELDLPGIDFVESTKRYYPNGNFASYIIGYAKLNQLPNTEDYQLVGELGIESYYEDKLKGENGYLMYEQDRNGYKIPDTTETKVEAKNGDNIYLTIDSGIQRFLESAMDKTVETASPEWAIFTVMDAKTGDILGSATSPSFDPNILDIKEYENPLVTFTYEPGSTMKTYTYICALEKGTYKGNEKFKSGSYTIGNDTIYDVNRAGWGNISYDEGYLRSSNVGVSNIVNNFINREDLKECLTKYGFGSKTNIELPREQSGSVKFTYPVEVASAAYGQGISITAIQALRAITLLSNNGKMLTPHIVSKIVDNSDNVIYERKVEESEQIISLSTVEYMKDLMYRTVYGDSKFNYTGNGYNIEGFDIIGKTGTAQFYDKDSGYSNGYNNYIYSFIGMFPKDDPQIITYVVMKKPKFGGNSSLKTAFKDFVSNIAKYKNMFTDTKKEVLSVFTMNNYINKSVSDTKVELEKNGINVVVIGDGDKVIDTYPSKNTKLVSNDRVLLFTNGEEVILPSMKNWSYKEADYLCKKLKINCGLTGNGFVVSQSVQDVNINDIASLEIKLENKKLKKNIDTQV